MIKGQNRIFSFFIYQKQLFCSVLLFHILMPYDMMILYFRLPCFHVSNSALFLSGVPDYFGRNKISSGGDLSHYSSASLY